jgi:hypothetical protein
VDGLGWFGGHSYGARSAVLDVDGQRRAAPLSHALLFVNGRSLRECIHPTFSFDAEPLRVDPDAVRHRVSVDGLDLVVEQQVAVDSRGRGRLVQVHRFTNPGAEALPLRVTRMVEHPDAGPAAGEDGATLALVGRGEAAGLTVTASGAFDGRAVPDRWGIGPVGWLSGSARHDAQPLPAGGIPDGASGTVAPAGSVVAGQEWAGEVAPGETVVLRTVLHVAAS